jgi:hypothetical protein
MLFFPFLVTTLIVATVDYASGTVTLPISMLADFGKNVFGPVKTHCQKLGEEALKEKYNDWILCKTAEALEKKLFEFGKDIMQHINIRTGTNEKGHTVSQI